MAEEGKLIGRIFDFFAKVSVAAIKLEAPLKVGDKIKVKGATTDFEQKVESMQSHNKALEEADAGDDVGIKLEQRARKGDMIYLAEL